MFLIATAGALLGLPAGAQPGDDSASDTEALRNRIEHLEREVQDLQAELYRDQRAGAGGAAVSGDSGPPPAGTPSSAQRVEDIEISLHQLTGQVETLSHQVDQLSRQVERMQKDMDYRFGTSPGGGSDTGAPGGGTMPDNGNYPATGSPATLGNTQYPGTGAVPAPAASGAPQALAPVGSSLGTVPESTLTATPQPKPATDAGRDTGRAVLPPPQPKPRAPLVTAAGDANAQFNAAMNLLARAQYDAARDAFRAFADEHPADQLAAEALYWAGDISYSAKKDYGEAARALAEMLKKYPKAPHGPEGMLTLGLSLLGLGQKQEGCATLAALPAKFPSAAPSVLARAKAEERKAGCR